MNIVITEAALHELQRNKETPVQYYRMVVTPGGCSGFKYGLYFESTSEDDDFIVDASEDVKILIDAFSGQYLEGIQLDYMKTLTESGFKFTNPNATGGCGCGSSFSA